MSLWKKITAPTGSNANILIRFVVGSMFLSEGILKFLYPMWQASGRFAKIGIPYPDFVGPFVGTVETVCGALVVLGLLTRPAALPLFIDISVAIFTTQIPVLLGHGFLVSSVGPHWPVRTDTGTTLGCIRDVNFFVWLFLWRFLLSAAF